MKNCEDHGHAFQYVRLTESGNAEIIFCCKCGDVRELKIPAKESK